LSISTGSGRTSILAIFFRGPSMRLFYKPWPFFWVLSLLTALGAGIEARAAETADWLIRGRYVLTMDPKYRLIEQGAVVLKGERILAVGSAADLEKRFQPAHHLDRPDAIIMPGLIDTHTHAAMSLFRAIADDKTLQDWLTNYIFPAESQNVSPDFVEWGTKLACLEMSLAGITTYTDMYYFEPVVAAVTKQAGLRGVLGQSIIGFPSPDYKNWQAALAGTEDYLKRYRHDPLITPAVAPHAIYTTPDEALKASHDLAVKYGSPLLIHLSETRKEVNDSLAKHHLTPTQLLEKLGVLNGRVVAAHGVWENDNDLRILGRHGTGVAHCPSSNTKLASGIAPVVKMLRAGINVGLGTDGFAGSNDTADLIAEMNLAAKLQKVTQMDPQVLPARQVIELATMGGARVLGLDREIGSLEPGKRADLITLSVGHPNAIPLYNVYSQIAYASKAADVEDVFVNGREIVHNRRMLTLNAQEVKAHAQQWQQKILNSLKRQAPGRNRPPGRP
jgi:5-methylthioadenosine/S-adenosylhomocysteine deaminase